MKVYRDAFVTGDLYSAAATSIVHRRRSRWCCRSASCASSSDRAFGEGYDVDRRRFRPGPPPGTRARGASRCAARRRPRCCCSGRSTACFPVSWVLIAATKTPGELFSTVHPRARHRAAGRTSPTCPPTATACSGCGWATPLLYAGVAARCCPPRSPALAGYALAKYRFPGRNLIFNLLIGGILVPAVVLAIPQYLLLSKVGLADTYWSVLLPQILSPYGIYLARIYAGRGRARRAAGGGPHRRRRARGASSAGWRCR